MICIVSISAVELVDSRPTIENIVAGATFENVAACIAAKDVMPVLAVHVVGLGLGTIGIDLVIAIIPLPLGPGSCGQDGLRRTPDQGCDALSIERHASDPLRR